MRLDNYKNILSDHENQILEYQHNNCYTMALTWNDFLTFGFLLSVNSYGPFEIYVTLGSFNFLTDT